MLWEFPSQTAGISATTLVVHVPDHLLVTLSCCNLSLHLCGNKQTSVAAFCRVEIMEQGLRGKSRWWRKVGS